MTQNRHRQNARKSSDWPKLKKSLWWSIELDREVQSVIPATPSEACDSKAIIEPPLSPHGGAKTLIPAAPVLRPDCGSGVVVVSRLNKFSDRRLLTLANCSTLWMLKAASGAAASWLILTAWRTSLSAASRSFFTLDSWSTASQHRKGTMLQNLMIPLVQYIFASFHRITC